jgi:hypothetical protein
LFITLHSFSAKKTIPKPVVNAFSLLFEMYMDIYWAGGSSIQLSLKYYIFNPSIIDYNPVNYSDDKTRTLSALWAIIPLDKINICVG